MSRNAPPTRTLRNTPISISSSGRPRNCSTLFAPAILKWEGKCTPITGKPTPSTFALHDAQLVMARAHGFDSWPKLKAFVNGITVRRLVEAVRDGNLDAVRSMVTARPELVHWTSRRTTSIERFTMPCCRPATGHRPLPHAAGRRRAARASGHIASRPRRSGSPSSVATTSSSRSSRRRKADARRAPRSALRRPETAVENAARVAIAAGDAAWLRARHADGMLENGNGLVSHAVAADRPDMLALLLDLGLDPDESGRVGGLEEVVPTSGEPLR